MLGEFCSSNFQSITFAWLSIDALLATSSNFAFWSYRTWANSTRSNLLTNWFINLRYLCILVSFVSKSPLTCPITSYESLLSKAFLAPSARAILSPVNIASYSASLLAMGNLSWTPYFEMSPSRKATTTPIPPLFCVDDPSICIVQSSPWTSSCSREVNSAMKFAITWAFMAVQGR